jgi:pentatricopeptide repeat domain-containing protein 1
VSAALALRIRTATTTGAVNALLSEASPFTLAAEKAMLLEVALRRCSKLGRWTDVPRLLKVRLLLPADAPPVPGWCFVTSAKACQKLGQWQGALDVLRALDRQHDQAAANLDRSRSGALVAADRTACYNMALGCLVKSGQAGAAIDLWSAMPRRGVERDQVTWHTAMDACAKSARGDLALDLVASMAKDGGVAVTVQAMNGAIGALGRQSRWPEGLALLRKMQGPSAAEGILAADGAPLRADSYSFGAALDGCAKGGAWAEALQLLQNDMPTAQVPPTVRHYGACLAALGTAGRWHEASQLLESMEAAGVSPSLICVNSAVAACAKAGQWRAAVALVAGLEDGGRFPAATADGGADAFTFTSALSACAAACQSSSADQGKSSSADGAGAEAAAAGRALVGRMEQRGLVPTPHTLSAAVTCFGRSPGGLPDALAYFDRCTARRPTSGPWVVPDIVCFNSLLQACAHAGDASAAQKVLQRLTRESKRQRQSGRGNGRAVGAGHSPLVPDTRTLNAALKAFAGQWRLATSLLRRLPARYPSVRPDARSYAAAMGACGRGGKWREAVSLLRAMETGRLSRRTQRDGDEEDSDEDEDETAARATVAVPRPDEYCYAAALGALAEAKQWRLALAVLGRMQTGDASCRGGAVAADERCFNVAMAAAGNAGRWQEALLLLPQMLRAGVQPSVVSCQTALAALAKAGEWQRALVLLEVDFPGLGLVPDAKGVTSAMAALEAGGEWERAIALLRRMPGAPELGAVLPQGAGPAGPLFLGAVCDARAVEVCAVACARAGEAQRAKALLAAMGAAPSAQCVSAQCVSAQCVSAQCVSAVVASLGKHRHSSLPMRTPSDRPCWCNVPSERSGDMAGAATVLEIAMQRPGGLDLSGLAASQTLRRALPLGPETVKRL